MGNLYYLRGNDYVPNDPNLNEYRSAELYVPITALFVFPLIIAFCFWTLGLMVEMVRGYYALRAISTTIEITIRYAIIGWFLGLVIEILSFVWTYLELRRKRRTRIRFGWGTYKTDR